MSKAFERAVSFVNNIPRDGPIEVSERDKLEFYGLFKQSTIGPCESKQPSTFDLQARYKWQAWKSLGNLDKDTAKKNYVEKLLNITKKMPVSDDRNLLIKELEGKQEADIELYVDMISQPSRALYWLFLLNNIPHTLKVIKLMSMEHKTESFLKINPLGTVPAINDNGYCINESSTIVRYLKATKEMDDNWYPENLRERVIVDRYLDWHPGNTRMGCAGYFRENYLNPKMGVPINETRAKLYLGYLKVTLKHLNDFWLKDDKFVGGLSKPSFADLQLFCELKMIELSDFDFSNWPKVQSFMKKLEKFTYYDQVHNLFNKLKNSRTQKPKL